MRRRTLVALLVASGTWVPACRTPTTDVASAEAFVRVAYARYADDKEPETLTREAADLFAPALLELIREDRRVAKGEVGLLDHDPICACQDWESLRVDTVEMTAGQGDSPIANVTFTNAGQATQVKLHLGRASGQWRITDVEEPNMPSLFRHLEEGLKSTKALRAPGDTPNR